MIFSNFILLLARPPATCPWPGPAWLWAHSAAWATKSPSRRSRLSRGWFVGANDVARELSAFPEVPGVAPQSPFTGYANPRNKVLRTAWRWCPA